MTTPRPLADSEKLPVQKHRNAETSKSPEKEDVPLMEKKSKKPKKKEKKHKEKEREKKKKVEKVRGQAHLSYQTGWGRDVLGCYLPFPMVCVSCTWREGSAELPHTGCVTSLPSNTTLPGCVVPVGAWTHGKRAGVTTGSQRTQVLWGLVSCACQGSHAFSGPVQLLQLKACVPVVSG